MRPAVRRACRLVVFGDAAVLEIARVVSNAPALPGLASSPAGASAGTVKSRATVAAATASAIVGIEAVSRLRVSSRLPRPSERCGDAAFSYLDVAARAVLGGRFDALVTAPLNKLWMNRAGHRYDGHTGYLSELSGRPAVMMLAGKRLRVVLVTTHLALSEVPARLTTAAVLRAAATTAAHLERFHAMPRPRLAVAALNPHGGESGLFGDEEQRIIKPALSQLRRRGIAAAGPLPADTLFAAAAAGDYDAVICMYHDQGLIPLKLVDFGRAVNVSMGLPLIRTSPDHGTAYDLAGSAKADDGSMAAAIVLAAEMVRKSRQAAVTTGTGQSEDRS